MNGRRRATLRGFGLLVCGWVWTRVFPDGALSWLALPLIGFGVVSLVSAVLAEFM
jgi:hypothetical protein